MALSIFVSQAFLVPSNLKALCIRDVVHVLSLIANKMLHTLHSNGSYVIYYYYYYIIIILLFPHSEMRGALFTNKTFQWYSLYPPQLLISRSTNVDSSLKENYAACCKKIIDIWSTRLVLVEKWQTVSKNTCI